MAHTRPGQGRGVTVTVIDGIIGLSLPLARTTADQQWHSYWVQQLDRFGLTHRQWETRHPCDRDLTGCQKVYLGRPEVVGDPARAHWGAVLEPLDNGTLLLLAFGRRHPKLPTGEPAHPDVYDVATRVRALIHQRLRAR